MTIEDIIDELGEPLNAYDRSQSIKPTEEGYYLYELYETFNFWESKTWFFNDLTEFYDYAYSHVMFDYINREESDWYDFDDETDQSELYQQLISLKNTNWTEEECKKFVKTFDIPMFELVKFGRVSEFFTASDEVIQKCKKYHASLDELERSNLSQGFYQIIHEYLSRFKEHPKENKQQFIKYISEN